MEFLKDFSERNWLVAGQVTKSHGKEKLLTTERTLVACFYYHLRQRIEEERLQFRLFLEITDYKKVDLVIQE